MSPGVQPRYAALSIWLHWLMLLLIAATYAFIELRVLFERGTPERVWMRQAHSSCGVLILLLVVVRLAARWRGGTPPISPPLPAWQQLLSRLTHAALYAFMIGMPLAGWAMLSMAGDPIVFFGLELPPIAAENEDLGELVEDWHGDIGQAFYAVLGLHAAAAIWHHRVRRDDTLRRMLPGA